MTARRIGIAACLLACCALFGCQRQAPPLNASPNGPYGQPTAEETTRQTHDADIQKAVIEQSNPLPHH